MASNRQTIGALNVKVGDKVIKTELSPPNAEYKKFTVTKIKKTAGKVYLYKGEKFLIVLPVEAFVVVERHAD